MGEDVAGNKEAVYESILIIDCVVNQYPCFIVRSITVVSSFLDAHSEVNHWWYMSAVHLVRWLLTFFLTIPLGRLCFFCAVIWSSIVLAVCLDLPLEYDLLGRKLLGRSRGFLWNLVSK